MKSNHTILKNKYMVNQIIYTDVPKLRLDKKSKKFSDKCYKKYGFYYPIMYDESISLACMLIELLSLYRDNTTTAMDRTPCYIPDTDWWFEHADRKWTNVVGYLWDNARIDDKANAVQVEFNMNFRKVSMKRMIHLIIKGCRMYLSNSYALKVPTKIDERAYKQFCKSIGKPYQHLSKIYVDDEFDDYCCNWFRYALVCLAFNVQQLWD